ncbi:hypothetical protein KI387_017984, partial [Taxus chinensis]
MAKKGKNARTETASRSSEEERRSHEEHTWQEGEAYGGIRVPVRGRVAHRERRNLCPNPQPSNEKFRSAVGLALWGFSETATRNSGGEAQGSENFKHRVSFKDALGKTNGNNLGNQVYLVDFAEEIPSLTIEVQEVEEYYQNLSRDAIIGRFN